MTTASGDQSPRSWNDAAAVAAIRDFVARVTAEGSPEFLPAAERVAVFDNDGTLWCEKPMPIELGFILQRLAAMAERDASLRERQPWKAEAYQTAAHGFLHQGWHPTLDRNFFRCGYLPMVELLEYLTANGFTCHIASGGDRDFMRPVTERIYGIPAERVIGSTNALRYEPDEHGGTIVYLAEPDYFNDGPTKWPGPSGALEAAETKGWTVVSVKRDWATVFDDATASIQEEGS
jgi:hypothetical protein